MRIGELFSGYGGLGLGVQAAIGGTIAWHSEVDPGACRILAHRYPDVPNLGDVTTVDWTRVEPVDVLTGGSPCQDVSAAGKRAGMRAGTRSGLWASMCDAIDMIRPRLVVWENVRGVLSAGADSSMEPCPICVGDERGPHLRALGRVVGDLAELGYDARWHGLRAADVGAPHGRFRVFVVAWPAADADGIHARSVAARDRRGQPEVPPRDGGGRHAAPHPDGAARGERRIATPGQAESRGTRADARGRDRASAADADHHGRIGHTEQHGAASPGSQTVRHRGHADGRHVEAARLDWGPYGPAVARWERTLGRVAPPPTEPGAKGKPRLSPRFVEWMMGLPAGWVTDVPGVTRNDQLKALGNGVVPQQAAAALRVMLAGEAVDAGSAEGLLPTPSVADAMGGHLTRSGARSGELLLPGVAKALAQDGAA